MTVIQIFLNTSHDNLTEILLQCINQRSIILVVVTFEPKECPQCALKVWSY